MFTRSRARLRAIEGGKATALIPYIDPLFGGDAIDLLLDDL